MTIYLTDNQNENFVIRVGFQTDILMTLNGLGVGDVTGHTFKFDIGQEGETALFTATATIVDALAPQKIRLIIPANAFSKVFKRLVLQVRWNDTIVERIIVERFIDIRKAVVPV